MTHTCEAILISSSTWSLPWNQHSEALTLKMSKPLNAFTLRRKSREDLPFLSCTVFFFFDFGVFEHSLFFAREADPQDDQHGTAIIAGAGLLNALKLVNKKIEDIKVVVSGCGAAGFTCAKYFISLGVKRENLIAVDIKGVVYGIIRTPDFMN